MKEQTKEIQVELGQVVMTSGVNTLLEQHPLVGHLHAQRILSRHRSGDWGDLLGAEDKASNDQAIEDGTRLLSAYELFGEKIWIITEWDRSVTTFLFPSEY